jgi:signal transduction histidine kinase
MDIRRRLPGLLLVLGAACVIAAVPLLFLHGQPVMELPWVIAMSGFVGAAAFTWRRLPEHPLARWFAVMAGLAAVVQALDGAAFTVASDPVRPAALAAIMFAQQVGIVGSVVAFSHLLGLFPDGVTHRSYERRVLKGTWVLLAFPPLVLLGNPTVLFPTYYSLPEVTNPFAVSGLAAVGEVAATMTRVSQGGFVVGVILLILRYRASRPDVRRRIRWLLLPALLAVFAVALDLLVVAPTMLMVVLWIGALITLPLAIAVALVRPDWLDVDLVLRRSLVYGLLWLLIAATYVAAAAGLGLAAGQRLPVTTAIVLTVVATLLFHPARRRLERVADRWVFGQRADPAQLILQLGAALEGTVELEKLLPRMAETLQEGLGLRWARVRLEPAPPIGDEAPTLTVPIVLDGERLGVVECGAKVAGTMAEHDVAVVETLARQAALAVRNVRLTSELKRSRARLVRAQDAERRRIERNIHDGVQQDLVALTGYAAHVRSQLERDPASGEAALDDLQAGLRRVIGELRELAHGIHPSVLSDRGLLEAVEALAGRSRIPVSVRADPSLRDVRFAEEIEGAGYFTVAEALANAGKHAAPTKVEVSLARSNGSLELVISDNGSGFDPTQVVGAGLVNLAERLTALGGRLDVASRPGGPTTITAQLSVADV